MRKLFLLPLLSLFFMACSVDNDELNLPEDQFQDLNAEYKQANDVTICGAPLAHNFEDSGQIEVMNDNENLYVTVSGSAGSEIANTRLHIADNIDDFPTVGRGNLPPGQMDHHEVFDPAQQSYTFVFPLEELDSDGSVTIASKTSFTNGNSSWAGDIEGNKGNWLYFEYDLQECEADPCDYFEQDEYSLTVENSYVDESIDDVGQVDDFLLREFFGYEEVPTNGSFDRTNYQILLEYNRKVTAGNWPFTITTTYTMGEENCEDSAVLTLTIEE